MSTETSTSTGTTGLSIFFPVFFEVVRAPLLPVVQAGPMEPHHLVIFPGGGGGHSEGLEVDPFAAFLREVVAWSEIEQGRRGPPPASEASILAMKTVDSAEGDCPICLERLGKVRSLEVQEEGEVKEGSFEEDAVIKEMPCGHKYHGVCIGKWLGMHGSCPTCRYQMSEEEDGGVKKAEEGGGED